MRSLTRRRSFASGSMNDIMAAAQREGLHLDEASVAFVLRHQAEKKIEGIGAIPRRANGPGATGQNIVGALSGQKIWIPDVNSGYSQPAGRHLKGPEGVPCWKEEYAGSADQLSHRLKIGLLVPMANTTVEHEMWHMLCSNPALKGVGIHNTNIEVCKYSASAEFGQALEGKIYEAVDRAMAAEPEVLLMGLSTECFWPGYELDLEFKERIREYSGLWMGLGAEALDAALRCYGAKRIAVITPWPKVTEPVLMGIFEEMNVDMAEVISAQCASWVDIAHVPAEWGEGVLQQLQHSDVDAIVHCGTNHAMVSTMDRLEEQVGKPCISVNAATLWYALRECGINEPMYGCTKLCREF